MKLYDGGRAPNPRRVRIFLSEKGMSVPIERIDLAALEHKSAEFTALNPLQRVPVLVLDNGTVITESIAICRYFEEQQPKPALFGEGAKERSEIEMWQRRMELGLMSLVTGSFQHTHEFFKGRIKQVPEWGAICKENALLRMAWMDGQLATRKFIAGDKYSVADITAMVAIDFGRPTGIRIAPELENLTRWHQDVSSRPSAKA
jgi:glutathione S-transferase